MRQHIACLAKALAQVQTTEKLHTIFVIACLAKALAPPCRWRRLTRFPGHFNLTVKFPSFFEQLFELIARQRFAEEVSLHFVASLLAQELTLFYREQPYILEGLLEEDFGAITLTVNDVKRVTADKGKPAKRTVSIHNLKRLSVS